MNDKQISIYALRCPITNQARYIGRTGNPKQRQSAHRTRVQTIAPGERLSPLQQWVKSLPCGMKPTVEVLAVVSESEAVNAEKQLIREYRGKGAPLLNRNLYVEKALPTSIPSDTILYRVSGKNRCGNPKFETVGDIGWLIENMEEADLEAFMLRRRKRGRPTKEENEAPEE